MEPRTGYYSLIQYCPDSSRLEALNVGLALLCLDPPILKTRLAPNVRPRLNKVFGATVTATVSEELEALNYRLTISTPPLTRDQFQIFADTRAGSLRLTAPRFVKLTQPDLDLDRLFDRLVPSPKSVPTRKRLSKRLEHDLRQHHLFDLVERAVEVPIPSLGVTFQSHFSFRNGRQNLIYATAIAPDPLKRLAQTGRLALEGQALCDLKDYRMVVVAEFPPDSPDATAMVKQQLLDHNVTCHDFSDLSALHAAIEEGARHHRLR